MSDNSTLTRRAIVRGAAALPAIAAVPVSAAAIMAEPDPIFAAIEEHRRAWSEFSARCSALDYEARYAEDEKAYRKAMRALNRLIDAVTNAENALVEIMPTSIAGAAALLAYAAEFESIEGGVGWPTDGNGDPVWLVSLHRNLAKALGKIAATT